MSTRLTAAAALILACGAAAAQDLSAEPVIPPADRLQWRLGEVTLALPGELRLVGSHASATPVAVEDRRVRPAGVGDGAFQPRLRLRPALVAPGAGFFYLYKLAADAELSGHLGNDTPLGQGFDPHQAFRTDGQGLRLTQAYALAAGRWLALKVGLVRGHFGVGMVANGGEDADPEDPAQSPFDVAYAHDRNLRFQLAFFPFEPATDARGNQAAPLALVVAADAVIEDDTADWYADDRAYQILGGALIRLGGLRLSGGAMRRTQRYAEGGDTDVWLAALAGRYDLRRRGYRFWIEGEAAHYTGETTLTQSPVREGPFQVDATGWIARAGVGRAGLDLALEGGYASGDDNPFDDRVNTFTFDREHRVGLVMFRQATRVSSAATAYNIADPTFRGHPNRGFDQLANGGAIQNALYLNPRLRYRLPAGLRLDIGYLYARSAVPVTDSFRSGLAGGAPVAWRGARDAQDLGHEVDLGLGHDWALAYATLRLRAQVGVYWPGDALRDALGNAAPTQLAGLSQFEVRW